ncbi:MAG TPA: NAD(P)-dependent oxidoreductase [Actinomycetota bacterium]|nr:NAD(P)-dependent oxidoreductase [Actinomycetota bacterium]
MTDKVARALVTGGAGFFGTVLKHRLLDEGFDVLSVDFCRDATVRDGFSSVVGDIAEPDVLTGIFRREKFDVVFHCAALLAHDVKDKRALWRSNVEGTRMLAEATRRAGITQVVFISSNCLWAENLHRPVTEQDQPKPAEVYGKSKWEGEKILLSHSGDFHTTVLRSPTIISPGRLGLLSLLFDFIREDRKVWVVGDGGNVYQWVYAPDVADACLLAYKNDSSGVFNVGSNDVRPMREVYEYVIEKAASGSRVASLPRRTTLAAMAIANALGMSPLGPYQRRMIAEDFVFDTSKINQALGWEPSHTNEEMLYLAYEHYHANFDEISKRTDVSAHNRRAKMGVIRLLKWLS